MKVLVTFAVAQEVAPWRKLRSFRRVEPLGVTLHAARIGDVEAHVVVTGMGRENAVHAVRAALMNEYHLCVSSGLAGGLKPAHPSGRVLVARTVRTGVGDEFIASDSRLRRLAAVCGARVVDAFYTADRMVQTAREKAGLGLLADAVDMESYAILDEARKWRVPALAIRVVGDAADADLPLDFNRVMNSRGRLSLLRLLAQLTRRPKRLAGLLRLTAESRRAATKLAAFLDSYLETLAGLAHEEDALTHKVTG